MNKNLLFSGLSCLAIGPWLAACAPISPDDDLNREPAAQQAQPFTTTPQEPNHEEITADALSFLRPDILVQIQAANVSTDVQFATVSDYHFDDCNFSGGSRVIAQAQESAVKSLQPNAASPASDAQAAFWFGRSLHTVQDFYSHSNWVELDAQGLLDDSLSRFPILKAYAILEPSGIQIVEGDPPKKTAVSRDLSAPYPENAVVDVTTKQESRRGLFSGSVDYEPGDKCPATIRMSHEELNKDKSSTPGREAQFVEARALAVEQTRHEWCRLLSLTQVKWGQAGAERLLTWAADRSAATDCPETAAAGE